MNPEDEDKSNDSAEDQWSYVDIASMINGNLEKYNSYDDFGAQMVHLSGGDHHGEGECVIDPDYFDILGMSDPSELIKRKSDISR